MAHRKQGWGGGERYECYDDERVDDESYEEAVGLLARVIVSLSDVHG